MIWVCCLMNVMVFLDLFLLFLIYYCNNMVSSQRVERWLDTKERIFSCSFLLPSLSRTLHDRHHQRANGYWKMENGTTEMEDLVILRSGREVGLGLNSELGTVGQDIPLLIGLYVGIILGTILLSAVSVEQRVWSKEEPACYLRG